MLRVRVPIGQLNYEQAKENWRGSKGVWRGLYRYYYPYADSPKIYQN